MKNKGNGIIRQSLFYIVVFLGIMGMLYYLFGDKQSTQTQQIQSSQFVTELKKNNVKDFTMQPSGSTYKVTGTYRHAKKIKADSSLGALAGGTGKATAFTTNVLTNDAAVKQIQTYAQKNNVKNNTKEEESSSIWIQLLLNFLPLVFIIFFFYMMMGQAGQGNKGPRGLFGSASSKTKPVDGSKNKVRFSDVAGAEEEKQELVEVVEFLRNPRKFAALGARIPAGVLLEGPPGTGKTLLAKAVAGEAGVPFFSISGSDFVEMFVGVGASRVRELFENAKKSAPSIIFIDEIDAVGRRRSNNAGGGGGHDEREQTLNQLLVEMDGFSGDEGIIVIAATNRADVLDPALLRPGRFDRKILVGRPDVKGREAILKVHAKNKPLADDVDLKLIAKQTPGFVGADLENLLNEAALLAARRDKKEIDFSDVYEAEDRVIAGPAKRDKVMSKHQRETVAYHEAGHAIIGLVLNEARTVHKVTIVPRGRAGGYAIMLPKEDEMIVSKKNFLDQIAGLMGGRAAEEIIFDQQSSGASNDFQQATQIARAMVTQYGMSDKLGQVQYEGDASIMPGQYAGNAPYSEKTADLIDEEVKRITGEAMKQAHEIIESHREQHEAIAKALLEFETLDEKQILSLFKTGKMPAANEDEFPSEKAATYEETKKAAEKKEAQKQEELENNQVVTFYPKKENNEE
ncbi:cell division protein FtsH, ATP-dependent zinc metallopeptidase [Ligilactobacillus hayakitensis DSM 18933 = JCM 14209]|uniref:ATP-dependent zinc metalloprotease FtsH n=1 Tax=Ligilactobacillus hayakitensis DSM 18933 = JCM 14209 TaxID=1423755 RepID=A0A0R1WPS1_9LACO|nr:ATP-dependent zinc metalloprotease FtsH [Ligilactobacillus hayakitensis]KRM19863.1 cell division protein FtsH, ATP-dependent zinc metallopeptidase [Ligilactobacillus hayakitensis DSM 18933 = JCM 14209]